MSRQSIPTSSFTLRCYPTTKEPPAPPYGTTGRGEAGGLAVEYVLLGAGEDVHRADDARVCTTIDMGRGRRLVILSRGLPGWLVGEIDRRNEVMAELGCDALDPAAIEADAMRRFAFG